MYTEYDKRMGYKPIKNINKSFEKMLLLWEWNKEKQATKLAMRIIIHLVKGGKHPKNYSRAGAYNLCVEVITWDYSESVWK